MKHPEQLAARRRGLAPMHLALALVLGCGGPSGGSSTLGALPSSTSSSASAAAGSGGSDGQGGRGGAATSELESLLEKLRADPVSAMLEQSRASGWPAPVASGHLYVSLKTSLDRLAGDHDGWTGTPMRQDEGFVWLVVSAAPGSRYKFSDGEAFEADPWSRAYSHDEYGFMSQTPGKAAHLERHFAVADASIPPRTVRVWVPSGNADRVLYAHDGQNLFNPASPWGGWGLATKLPPNMMVVGVDNSPSRMSEYTHVQDDLGSGLIGGRAYDYVNYLVGSVRQLVAKHYGEPTVRGILGSSLGGLVSLYAVSLHPDLFTFAGSMSGTLGWGSIGLHNGQQNETIIEKFRTEAPAATVLYVDSGGQGVCQDNDQDGIKDDGPNGADNYCVSRQLVDELTERGKVLGKDLFHWHEPGAPHNEQAWSERVALPLKIFSEM